MRPIADIDPEEMDLVSAALADPTSVERMLDIVELADAAAKRFAPFVRLMWSTVVGVGDPLKWGWPMDAICEHLEAVARGEIIRLLMNVPPGFAKSLLCDVFFPAWEWGPLMRPHMQYIAAAYGAHLTQRDNDKFKKLITSDLYRTLWPHVELTREAVIKVENTAHGFKLATSVGGVGTGERGHRFLLDDPNNVNEAESEAIREAANRYTAETVPSRLNVLERDAIIVIQQRTHDHDVSGMILEEMILGSTGERLFTHLCIPMHYEADHKHRWPRDPRTIEGELAFPERFPPKALEILKTQLRAVGGDYAEAGQLQQRPQPRGGGMFKAEWWLDDKGNPIPGRVIRPDQVPEGGTPFAGGWDFAGSTKDNSPFTVRAKGKMGPDGKVYITNIKRVHVEAADLAGFVEETIRGTRNGIPIIGAEFDGPQCVQDMPADPGQAGKFQVAHLVAMLHGYEIHSSQETGDKAVRAAPFASQCKHGNVILVDDGTGWIRPFITEAKSFPVGRYKDQIDALSRLYARLVRMMAGASTGTGLGMPALITAAR